MTTAPQDRTTFADRTALVTGSTNGIGRATALALAERGAHVLVSGRDSERGAATVDAITRAGGSAEFIAADLSSPDGAHRLAGAAVTGGRAVDILVNNAAVVAPIGPSAQVDPTEWAAALQVNITAPALLSFALLPAMVHATWGRIVNVSSGIAAHPASMIGMNAYAAGKAALEAHTLNLAAELGGTGVTVNAFRPGSVDTAMQAWIRGQDPEQIGSALHERFARSYADSTMNTPDVAAGALLDHLDGEDSGQVWELSR